MEEELAKILGNADLDEAGKQGAIKTFIETGYVPAKKYRDEINTLKGTISTKESEFTAYKQTKMTEEEKKAEQEKVFAENQEKRDRLLSKMVAENVFSKAGFKEDEYKDFLDTVVQTDYEQTQSFAEKICGTMMKQKQAMEQKLKDEITKSTPKPPAGDSGNSNGSDIEKYQKSLEEAISRGDYSDIAYYQRLIQEELAKQK